MITVKGTWYVSGPMRGKPGFNHETFHAVEAAFKAANPKARMLNPARNFGGDTTRNIEEYLTLDIGQVLDSDGLVMLPGWEKSEGAQLEVSVARATGKAFVLALEHPEGGWIFEPADLRLVHEPVPPRAEVLDEAKGLITGDRNNQYGPPTQDFQRTAAMLNALGYRGPGGRDMLPHDFSVIQITGKLSRMVWSPGKRDHWVDIPGYSGCGWECVVEEQKGGEL